MCREHDPRQVHNIAQRHTLALWTQAFWKCDQNATKSITSEQQVLI